MVTRPSMHTSQTDAPTVSCPSCAGPALTHTEWLSTLKRGDTVRVRTHTGDIMPAAMVTNETPCYVFVGKLKFWRRHGWQVKRQGKQVYRMRLRLIRDGFELVG